MPGDQTTGHALAALIADAFAAYDATSGEPAAQVVAAWLGGTAEDERVAAELAATVMAFDARHREIEGARQAETTREDWLAQTLLRVAGGRSGLPEALAEGFTAANLALMGDAGPVTSAFGATAFEPSNVGPLAAELLVGLEHNTLVALTAGADGTEVVAAVLPPGSALVRACLTGEGGDDAGRSVTTLVGGALVKAQRAGCLDAVPALRDAPPEGLALVADRGVELATSAYKLATGEWSPSIVTDRLIDRATARFTVLVERAAVKVGGDGGAWVGAAVGAYFGPAGAALGAQIGRVVGEAAGRVVAEQVANGLRALTDEAKAWARGAVNRVVETGREVVAGVLGFLGF